MSRYSDVVLSSVPSLYLRLGEPSGTTATDLSGNGRNGTYFGSPGLGAAGLIANDPDTAMTMVGGSTYAGVMTTYQPFAAASQRSFEGWYISTDSGSVHVLWGDGTVGTMMLRLAVGASDVAFWPDTGAGNVVWTAAWPGLNVPVHWVLTFNDATDTAELYINGVSKGTKAQAVTWNSPTAVLQIGDRFNGVNTAQAPWKGTLDEFAVYERILAATEVYQHYLTPLPFVPHRMPLGA